MKILLVLIQYLLIKIGNIPLKSTIFFFNLTINLFKSITIPKIRIPQINLPKISLPKRKLKRGPKKRIRFITKKRSISFILSTLTILIIYTWIVIKFTSEIPSPVNLYNIAKPVTTEIFDRNGVLIYRIYDEKNRSFVKIQELPKDVINATIAIEDKNFYHHFGIDLLAIIRASYHNFKTGSLEGASTLTQQLVKNTLLSTEKTYKRKIKEVILSILTEGLYSKDQILEMYFNEAPYGGPIWGIKAASLTYFGKDPKQLSLSEAAFLAGLPASPTEFSPYGTTSTLGFARQKQVLQRMVDEKYITEAQKQQALNEKLIFQPLSKDISAGHFVFYVKDFLSKKFGPRVVSMGGLKVTTTLDLNLQKQVEEIVSQEVEGLSSLNVKNGAAMVVDPKTGQILAMVGSRDYNYPNFGNFNVALALRQPGSSIKPVTYATAFKSGFAPGNTILDIPTSFKNAWETYKPVNYDGRFHGPVSMRVALASSLNIPAVKTLATVGIDPMLKTARDLGITTFNQPERYGLSLTLGGAEVKMIDMMSVYSTFSQMGTKHEITPILRVTDSSGNLLEEYHNNSKNVLQPEIAYMINDILSDNNARSMAFGTNSLLNMSPNIVSVKTGTTDNKRDNWTFGYTNDFVVGAWVGNPDNLPMDQRLTSGITGAAPIWNKITSELLKKYPSSGFLKPAGITNSLVDGRKDLVIAGTQTKTLSRIRKESEKIIFSDAFSTLATNSGQTAVTEGEKIDTYY